MYISLSKGEHTDFLVNSSINFTIVKVPDKLKLKLYRLVKKPKALTDENPRTYEIKEVEVEGGEYEAPGVDILYSGTKESYYRLKAEEDPSDPAAEGAKIEFYLGGESYA